jgi:hypothetical protein
VVVGVGVGVGVAVGVGVVAVDVGDVVGGEDVAVGDGVATKAGQD